MLPGKDGIDILEGLEKTGFQYVHEEDIEDIEELDDVKNIYTLTYIQLLKLSGEGPQHNMKIIAKSNNLKDNSLPLPHYQNGEKIRISLKSFTDKQLFESPKMNSRIFLTDFTGWTKHAPGEWEAQGWGSPL